jgi:phosphoenolpyruvate carboxylase
MPFCAPVCCSATILRRRGCRRSNVWRTCRSATIAHLCMNGNDFVPYFHNVTPITEISRLNIGSRPASRRNTGRIEDLRAIPWGIQLDAESPHPSGLVRMGFALETFVYKGDAIRQETNR